MAVDEADEIEDAGEDDSPESALRKSAVKNSIFTYLLLSLNVVALGVAVGLVFTGIDRADSLLSKGIRQRFVQLAGSSDDAMARAKEQYAEYHQMMTDPTIFSVTALYDQIFSTSLEAGRDDVYFIETYQSAIYGLAAKVSGSGVWYEFYNRDLGRHLQRSQLRLNRLAQLSESKPDRKVIPAP